MEKISKDEILASSSIWVSILLNFFPGLGTGYIYQRRWKAYWLTNIAASSWVIISFLKEVSIDPNDPAIIKSQNIYLIGLFLISIITSVESWISTKEKRVFLN